MTSGSLTDLDPPPSPERRWPFYVAWGMGGAVIGAVLFSHLPPSSARLGSTPAPEPVATAAVTAAPVAPRIVNLPPAAPLRVAPLQIAPARP
jgi:hypothetical protein